MFLNIQKTPLLWSSLHRAIIFKFSYPNITLSISNSGGKCSVQMFFVTDYPTLKVGDQVFMFSTILNYQGYHTITSIVSNDVFITDRGFVQNAGATAKVIYTPEFEIYTGIPNSSQRPTKKIATVKPQANTFDNNTITVDVSGFLKGDFPIPAPKTGIDHSMYNRFWLKQVIGSASFDSDYYYVANATLPHNELQPLVNNFQFMDVMKPIKFSCQKIIYSTVEGNTVRTIISDGGTFDDGSGLGLVTEDSEYFITTESGDILTTE
jgi:hypothetical protein